MKKGLLIASLAFAVAANAQPLRMVHTDKALKAPAKGIIETELLMPAALPAAGNHVQRIHPSGNQVQFEVALGSSGNAFGVIGGSKTNLWYDQDLNTIAFTHRANPPGTSDPYTTGYVQYDYSTDGGVTWTNNQGFVYRDTTWDPIAQTQSLRGRYPQGAIYNPTGNTNPANAYLTCWGPITDGTDWIASYGGTSQLGSATNTQQVFNNIDAGINATIGNNGCVVKNTGTVWWVGGSNGINYNDTIYLTKGTYNGAGGMNYEFVKVPAIMCLDDVGAKMHYAEGITFSDDGEVGYLTILGNDWVCNVQNDDSTFGLIVFKTIDGGDTWTELGRPVLSLLDPVLLNGNYFCTSAFDMDCGMDKNNNLHTTFAIGPSAGGGAISTGHGSWGLFDITTPDGGLTWDAYLLAKPQTFRGTFGDGGTNPTAGEDSRPQVSRSWDGSKMFFSWFDTDTLTYGTTENIFPDLHTIGYDVDANMWTAEINHTGGSGTTADGGSLWGNCSYYTINDGTDETIPMVFCTMLNPPISTASPVNFFYIGDLAMNNYNQTNTPIHFSVHQGYGNNPAASNQFSVSANYPNPFTGKTSIDVNLVKASNVTVEISNAVGQVISTNTYENLHSGVNTLTLDGSSLSKGLYFYSVKAGGEVVTKTMSVE